APGMKTIAAEEAFAARDREWHHHPIADLELLVFRADLDHLALVFMAENVAFFHLRDDAPVDVQVGPADRARRDLDGVIARMLDLRFGNLIAADIAFAVPRQSLHGALHLIVGDPLHLARNASSWNAQASDSVHAEPAKSVWRRNVAEPCDIRGNGRRIT